jgi:RHS repeat-associated protein
MSLSSRARVTVTSCSRADDDRAIQRCRTALTGFRNRRPRRSQLQTLWSSDKGREVRRTYGDNGKVASREGWAKNGLGTLEKQRAYSYEYNLNGSLKRMADLNVATGAERRTTTYEHDDAERELQVDEASFELDGETRRGKDTKFVYDSGGNVLERKTDGRFQADGSYAGGKTATFGYDPLDRETQEHVAAPDEADRTTATTYWPSGERRARTTERPGAGDDTVERTFFLSDGRLARMDRKRAGAADFAKSKSYDYGTNGNRIEDERGSYGYNARGQVVSWTRPGGTTTSYTLNGVGSIVAQQTGADVISYEYAADGRRVVAATQAGARTVYNYSADGLGNMTSYGPEGQPATVSFEYDSFGWMIHSTRGSSDTTYSYDGLDRRDTRQEGSQPPFDLSYVGSSEALSQEQQFGGPGELRSYDYTSGLGERLGTARRATTTDPTASYHAYQTDANGSVEALEDDHGALMGATYGYDPYGAQTTDEGDLSQDAQANPFRFEGHYYDDRPQSYDMQAREYLPELGRFLQEDRYEDATADQQLDLQPTTNNRYQFTAGNPVDNIEFDGHKGCTATCRPQEHQQNYGGEVRRVPGERDEQSVDFTGSREQADFAAATRASEAETEVPGALPPPRPPRPADAGRTGLLTAPTMRNSVGLHWASYDDEAFPGRLPPAHLSNGNEAVGALSLLWPIGGETKGAILGGRFVLRQLAEHGGEAAAKELRPASNAVSGKLLKRQLASEAQIAERGTPIFGPGTGRPLREAPRLAAKYGGRAEDWTKMGSSTYNDGGGLWDLFETHWYQNVRTGLRVEPKTKFPRAEDYFGGAGG